MRWFLSLIAILFLGFALYLANPDNFYDSNQSSEQGLVLSVKGRVMGRASRGDQNVSQLQAHSPLHAPMELITGLEGETNLNFGETFRVFPQSNVLLEKIGPKFRVHLLKGRLLRSKADSNTEFIVKGLPADPEELDLKVRAPLSEDEAAGNSQALSAQEKQTSDSSTASPTSTEANLQKSREQSLLKETLSLHQRFLEKCFIKHFERLKGQTRAGQVLMKFVIQKDGRLRKVSIKKSPYSDEALHKCLIAVMNRVRIKKAFDRDTSVEFPLQISLP